MQKDFNLLWIAMAAGSLLLTGCGGGGNLNQQMILPQTQTQRSPYAYASPLQPNTQQAAAQPIAGGKAVATPTGYVYEQDSSTQNAAYNFYHSQNPCLYPKPGQVTNCANGSNGYYAGQQQTHAPSTQLPGNGTYPQAQYGQVQYAQAQPAISHNPYANPYGSGTAQTGMTPSYNAPQMQGGTSNAYGTNNPYLAMNNQAPVANNPYSQYGSLNANAPQALPQPLPQPQQQQVLPPVSSESQRAQSRIAPDGVDSHGSSGSKQKITF